MNLSLSIIFNLLLSKLNTRVVRYNFVDANVNVSIIYELKCRRKMRYVTEALS
jgi:hypothetical protein